MTVLLPAARTNPVGRLLARFPTAPWSSMAEAIARVGYVARGTVYLAVGLVALLAALGLTPHARGPLGALEAWGEWPAGVIFLWLIGLGLYGFAGWRALQSATILDAATVAPRQQRSALWLVEYSATNSTSELVLPGRP